MFTLKKAFWCLELNMGTNIVGWFFTVSAIVSLIAQMFSDITTLESIISISILAVQAVLSICVILGVSKPEKKLLLPWLIFTIICILITTILYIISMVTSGAAPFILLVLIIDVIVIYLWLIVYSFYVSI